MDEQRLILVVEDDEATRTLLVDNLIDATLLSCFQG